MDNDIFLIIELYREKENVYLFDFADEQSFNDFVSLLRPDDRTTLKGASMIEIINANDNKKYRDGTYYKLNKKWVSGQNLNFVQVVDSAVIRYRIDLNQESLNSFFNGTGTPDLVKFAAYESVEMFGALDQHFPAVNGNPFDTLSVRYVGQGSWNEFLLGQSPKLVFDIGTVYTASRAEVRAYMKVRDKDYQAAKPVLLLSHWDVDHYHMLLEAEDETIRSFSKFIFRDTIPNFTSSRVYDRFLKLNPAAMFPVCAEPPEKGRSSKKLKMIPSGTYIKIYNGSVHKNRNLSGIMLSFQTHKMVIVCAADFEYRQLQKYVLGQFPYPHKHYLVVPHHGGNAGKVVYEPLQGQKKDAIISVGKYELYGHPDRKVIEILWTTGFHVVNFQTYHGHYELPLR